MDIERVVQAMVVYAYQHNYPDIPQRELIPLIRTYIPVSQNYAQDIIWAIEVHPEASLPAIIVVATTLDDLQKLPKSGEAREWFKQSFAAQPTKKWEEIAGEVDLFFNDFPKGFPYVMLLRLSFFLWEDAIKTADEERVRNAAVKAANEKRAEWSRAHPVMHNL